MSEGQSVADDGTWQLDKVQELADVTFKPQSFVAPCFDLSCQPLAGKQIACHLH